MSYVNQVKVAEMNSQLFSLQEKNLKANNLVFFENFAKFIKEHDDSFSQAPMVFIGDMLRRKSFTRRVKMTESFKKLFEMFTTTRISYDLNTLKSLSIGYVYAGSDYSMECELFWLILYIIIAEPTVGHKYLNFRLDESFGRTTYFMHMKTRFYEEYLKISKFSRRYELDICSKPPDGAIYLHH